MTNNPYTADVAIIGGGPAGSSAAITLAQAGRSVLLLERRAFPRFHIGESMLPYMMPLLRRLGVLDEVNRQGYVGKYGAEFIFPTGAMRRVDFAEQGPGRYPRTLQVERAHFDEVLLTHAQKNGVTVMEEAHVNGVLREDGQVVGLTFVREGQTHSVRARHVIDAGGRASKIAQQMRLRKENSALRNVAVFRHYGGLDERHNPAVTGDIQIGGHHDGWIWAIPIWPDTISVGAVMPKSVLRGAKPQDLFEEHLARIPRITQRLTGTTPLGDYRVETDYCYYSDTVAGPGWTLAGDAGCFIDPIFSGGVYLALLTGIEAGVTAHAILAKPDEAIDLRKAYSDLYKTGYDTYTRLIYAYYESSFNLGAYLRNFGIEVVGSADFAQLLAGDFWSRDNAVAEWLRSESRWDTFAKFDVVRGCPVYPHLDNAEQSA